MAFPQVAASNSANPSGGGAGGSFAITLPSGVSNGDLLVCAIAIDGGSGTSGTFGALSNGWDYLDSSVQTTMAGAVVWKYADGTDTLSIPYTSTVGEICAYVVYRITGAHGTSAPEISAEATGANAAPDPGSLSPSWGSADTLWIAVTTSDDGQDTVTGYPTDYSGNQVDVGNGASTGARCGAATRELAASSDDPGAFTLSASEQWVAWTIAVRPAAGGGGGAGGSSSVVEVEAVGAGVAIEAAAGGSSSVVEVEAVGAGVAIEAAAGGSSSVVEVEAVGAGVAIEAAAGGSSSVVEVSAAGAGVATEAAAGGSASAVHVIAAGAGVATETAAGGSASIVEVVAVGAGSAQEEGSASGGSASTVEITTAGAGTAVEAASGGSASAVHVTATGAGVAAEVASGGSSSAVEVASVGGGAAQQDGAATGGSSSVVIVTSTGGGYAIEFAFGGSQSTVTVNSTGAGQAEESGDNQAGGSASMAVVLAAGAGYATEFAVGGSSSIVQVRAVGYGFAPNTQPRVLSIFERMSATILRTLGKPSYYNGSTEPVMINIEHDVQMAGMGAEQAAYRGDYVANRDIATVPMDLNPRVGDRFVQDGVLWRLESLHSDKGANRRFVVSRVKT